MLFRRDNEHEREVWVDRGLDGRVDNSFICEPCDGLLRAIDPRGEDWHDMESRLCPECHEGFESHALAVDFLKLPRPFNGDIVGRCITNDEFAEEQLPGIPQAFDYFVPDRGDRFLPGSDDAFQPGPEDGFLPGLDDAFKPGPGDGFMPGPYDAFRPGPYDAFQPGSYDQFLPDPGDYFLPGMEDDILPE